MGRCLRRNDNEEPILTDLMEPMLIEGDITALRHGWNDDPALSLSLNADTYTDPQWIDIEREAVFVRTWQWVCHREKLSTPSSYVAVEVAGRPVSVICDGDGELRAFYNVCKHRGHELLAGEGQIKGITCPYHAWTYDLTGQLKAAPKTNNLPEFSVDDICLDQVLVETFCGFVYVNLDPTAAPMTQQTGALEAEIRKFAPDVEDLTFSLRLTYDIKSNWKVVVDNFLECYHCPTAHKEFCELVDMDTYEITTHGIYSSHMAEARKNANSPYPLEGANRNRPCGLVALAKHLSDALSGAGQLHHHARHPCGPARDLRDVRLLLRNCRPDRGRGRGDQVHRQDTSSRRHRHRRERAARHGDPGVPAGQVRLSARIRHDRTRGASFPWIDA